MFYQIQRIFFMIFSSKISLLEEMHKILIQNSYFAKNLKKSSYIIHLFNFYLSFKNIYFFPVFQISWGYNDCNFTLNKHDQYYMNVRRKDILIHKDMKDQNMIKKYLDKTKVYCGLSNFSVKTSYEHWKSFYHSWFIHSLLTQK